MACNGITHPCVCRLLDLWFIWRCSICTAVRGRRCRRTGTRRHVGMRQHHVHSHIFHAHDLLMCCAAGLACSRVGRGGGRTHHGRQCEARGAAQAGAGAVCGAVGLIRNVEMYIVGAYKHLRIDPQYRGAAHAPKPATLCTVYVMNSCE